MTQPERSYVLWFTQRVGSTLLAQALEDTGVAGHPREWFNADSVAEVMARHRAATALQLRGHFWRVATTSNGVLGIKYGLVPKLHDDLVKLMTSMEPAGYERSYDAWESFFPNCSHCFLTRRDKVRLAVSWWRAIKSGEWHRPNRSDTSVGAMKATAPTPLLEQYDFFAIRQLLKECSDREAAIHRQLDAWGIEPLTIVYEDLIANFKPTVRAVLEFLRVPHADEILVRPPAFDALADGINEAWYDRFQTERRLR